MIEIDGVLLPAHWVKSKVSELYEIVGGGTPSTKEERYWDGEISWISSADIYGIREIKPRRTITEEGIANSTTNLVPAESLVVVTRVGLGKIAITEKPICFSQDSHALVDKARLLFPDFFLYYLSQAVQKFKYQHRGTTIAGVTRKQLSDLPIPLPPLNEQRRIVSKIEELTAHSKRAREALEEVPKLIDQFRQSVLAAAFRGDLTAEWREQNPIVDAATNLNENFQKSSSLPSSWRMTFIGEVVESLKYGTSKKCSYETAGVPVLRIPNVSEGQIDHGDLKYAQLTDSEKKDLRLHPGDLLVIRSNGSVSLVGRSALVRDEKVDFAYAGYLIRLRPNQDLINPEFLNFCLSSHNLRLQIEIPARSTSGVHNINSKEIQKLSIPFPPFEEQAKIVQRVRFYFASIAKITQDAEIAEEFLTQLNQSILAKAFRGELVPQDPNDEPASVLLERIRAEREKLGQSNKKGRSRRQKTTSQLSIEEL